MNPIRATNLGEIRLLTKIFENIVQRKICFLI